MSIRFADISPEKFEILREAKTERDEWMTTAILNIVDISRIDRDIADVKIPAKYNEQSTKYITIHNVPKVKPQRKKQQELPVYTTVNELTEEISAEPLRSKEIHQVDYKAKVEPKSAEQVERIIRAKIKNKTIRKIELKNNKAPKIMWISENLM
jgi:hypothetical protein